MKNKGKGFSLMELMIVISIVAIMLSVSYPSYKSFVRKSNRAEAIVTLLDWANEQAIWRADNPSYSNAFNPATGDLYAYTIVSNAVSFTLTATAINDQAADKEDGISCGVMTLNQAGTSGPSGYETCWSQ